MRVFITNIMMLREQPRFEALLKARGLTPVFAEVAQYLAEEQLLRMVGDFDGWLAGDDQITRDVLLKALPRLRVISKWGTGLDSIDLLAAKELGVPVYNSPGAFRDAVAEVAIAFMLDLTRHISFVDRQIRGGSWPKICGTGLVGKTLGLVGFGAIGRGIASRALAMGMKVVAHDPQLASVPDEFSVVTLLSFNELLQGADVVCLACNYSPANHYLIRRETIEKMKEGAFLINVARGALVCEVDLVAALQCGKLGGAGLDVFEVEPLPADSVLVRLDNVVLSSHNANNLHSATESVHMNTLKNLYLGLGV